MGALAQQYLLDAPRTVDSVMGDVVVTFLLIRGLILRKLQRIWEAVTMFKLIDVLKVNLISVAAFEVHCLIGDMFDELHP